MTEAIQSPPKFWWKEKSNVSQLIFETVANLKKKQSYIYNMNELHIKLYGNYLAMGLDVLDDESEDFEAKICINLIQQCVDSAQAKIAKNRPRPRFLTEAGQYSLKRKGQKLGKFIEGVYYDCDTYQEAQQCFSDSGILGTGAMKIFVAEDSDGNKKVKHERVLAHKLVIDQDEARSGKKVRTIYQVEYISKYELAESYPGKADFCLGAGKLGDDEELFSGGYDTACVPVVEAFRVPVGKTKGRHIICTSAGILFEEEWTHKKIPYDFFKYRPRQIGFWGQGIAEINTGFQVEINRLLQDIQTIIHIGCVPKIGVEDGSDIVSSHLNNDIGTIIKFRGTPPTYIQLLHVPPELWQGVEYFYEAGFKAIGLNAMSVTGTKPAELQSGVALREYNDIESERFAIIAQDFEKFHINIWKHTIEYAEELAKEDKKYSILALNTNGAENLAWRDVRLEANQYILQVYPTNLLSKNPSGRMDDVKMLLDMQMIDVEEGLGLLEFPDTENFYKMKNAIRSSIEAIIDGILDKGEYETPSPLYGPEFLEKGSTLMRNCYFFYKNEGLELDKLELFTRWINDAMGLLEEMVSKATPLASQEGGIIPGQEQGGLPEMGPGEAGLPGQPGEAVSPNEQVLNQQPI